MTTAIAGSGLRNAFGDKVVLDAVFAVRLRGGRCVVAYAGPGIADDINGLVGLLSNGECLTA